MTTLKDWASADAMPRRSFLAASVSLLAAAGFGAARADDATHATRLRALGLQLPGVSTPIANFVHWKRKGQLVFVAGQLPMREGKILHPGRVGVNVTPDQAKEAAALCALNVLGVVSAACDGDINRVRGCVRIEGFVACDPSFTSQPGIINGASDLLVSVLGPAGKHARLAVGVAALPLNACVEVAATFSVA